jgi:CheY-like chemotaxis protein/two-component sensor histidine kinase
VDIASGSGQSLLRLISDILDLSKIEAGKIEVVFEEFRLDEVLKSIVASFREEARQKGIYISIEYPQNTDLVFKGDEKRLKQILFNLVGNAVKFTEQGGVKVEAVLLGVSSFGEERLLLIISDTGEGIAERDFKRIFDAFTQADGKYNRKFQGTGLGLAIVKRLIGILGGNIQFDSMEGEGTAVYVRLDLEPVHRLVQSKEPKIKADLPSLKVLVVEDNPVNRMTLMHMLQRLGLETVEAEDGLMGLEVLSAEKPDVVLMDVQMPKMDGLEATNVIRSGQANGADPDVPIIAVTAHAMVGDKKKFLDQGMDDYIAKPVDMETLAEVILDVMQRKKGG